LGIVSCLAQMAFLNKYAWQIMAVWMAIGVLVYFIYGRNNAIKVRNNGK
jgi:APA family basic amino acid/polyamine antiporter